MKRTRRTSVLKTMTVVLTMVAAMLAGVTADPTVAMAATMSNGWTSPLASMARPADGFLANSCGHPSTTAYLAGQFHIGADFWGSSGDPVYALGDGTVKRSQGFGEGTYVVMIEHIAPDGTHFIAVYGHLNDAGRPAVNAVVHAGAQIGTLNPAAANGPHLHLGVIPSTTIPSSNWGNMPCPSPDVWPPTNTNTFVDPMGFLNTHGSTTRSTALLPQVGTVFNTANNTASVYAVGTDGQLKTWYQNSAGSGFSGPSDLGGSLGSAPVGLFNPYNNTASIYATGTDGQLYIWYQNSQNSTFTGPSPLGGSITGTPSVIMNPTNHTASVYALGTNGQLTTWWQNSAGGGFTGPGNLGGSLSTAPVAVMSPYNNTASVYAVGTDGQLITWYQNTAGSAFTGPSALGGDLNSPPMAIFNLANGTASIYAVGADGTLDTWYQNAPNAGFTGPSSLGGSIK